MKKLTLLLTLLTFSALHAELPEKTISSYWKAVAVLQSQRLAHENSLTSQQKSNLEAISAQEKTLQSLVEDMKKGCTADEALVGMPENPHCEKKAPAPSAIPAQK